jgi:acetate kinase
MARLSWVGEVPVHVVGANEERVIAKEALALLAAS